jgi:IS605 OrfB family transposase
VVAVAEEHGVAIATERLKRLRKSRRGDGSGRSFRRKQHRFAYRSLLEKIHSLARKRGVEVLEVSPQDTSTIGMLKYAPSLHLSKDVAAAYVIGRRALGFEEKLPKGYRVLLRNKSFFAYTEGFYGSRLQELQKLKEAEKNPYLKRRLSREIGKARRALSLLLSFPGPQKGRKASFRARSGSRKGSTERKEPLRRQSLEGPEGRPLPSPSRARGAERPLSPQARPFGTVGEVEKRPRPSSWWGVGAQKCALWLTQASDPFLVRVTALGLLRLLTNVKAMDGKPLGVREAWEVYRELRLIGGSSFGRTRGPGRPGPRGAFPPALDRRLSGSLRPGGGPPLGDF